MSEFRLPSEFGKIRTGPKTSLQLCRLPVRPSQWPCPAHSGQMETLLQKILENFIPSGLSALATHVLASSANSNRETSSAWPTAHETHTVASQKQLEGTRVTRKGHTHTNSLHPHLKWCLEESNVLPSQPLHPLKHALQIWRKLTVHKLSGTKCSLFVFFPKTVSRPPQEQHTSYSYRQHHSGCLHKQGGGITSGTLCALLWRIVTWCSRKQVTLEARHIPGLLNVTAEKLSRLGPTIQTEWSLLPEVFQAICKRYH